MNDEDTVIELQWHCIPPEPTEDKVEKVSNQKEEIITAPTIITTNQQPQKLFSTYKGTRNQNFQLLYRVTPWYADETFTKKSFYGENDGEGWVDGLDHGSTKRQVSFWIRKKFWDEWCEAPNLDGVSKWKDNVSDLKRAREQWKNSTGDFAGYDKPLYRIGKIEDTRKKDWLTFGTQFSGPLGKAYYPKNMGQRSANELDYNNPIRFNKPTSTNYKKEGGEVSKRSGVFQVKSLDKNVWR